jgi:hypothetical protein
MIRDCSENQIGFHLLSVGIAQKNKIKELSRVKYQRKVEVK